MAGKSVLEKIRAEDEKVKQAKAKRDKLVEAARVKVGAIAEKAGLFEVDVSDEDLQKAFEQVAARFRKQEKQPVQAASSNPAA